MIRYLPIAASTFFLASAVTADAQTLRVQIVNGRNGKLVANEHVNFFRTGEFGDLTGSHNVGGFYTNKDGVVVVSQIASEIHSFTVSVDWHRQCAPNYGATFSLSDIFTNGTVSENTCKPKHLRQTPLPGTLVLYVRDETFFEKMAH
jgi:hypothetical protein